ncbi:cora-like Mg2+ transporter protein-domain-containing protein [Aspergillus multicolor]|uniref:cora-like Mg2+ transporter protein-domain-containing protein n=1 Tax=Aspergillus multicolor TaxID=41759 RepID=UPI003CCCFAD3
MGAEKARIRKHRDIVKDMDPSEGTQNNKNAMTIDNSLMTYLDKVLSETSQYQNQGLKSDADLDILIASLQSSNTADLTTFAVNARELIEHFITTSMRSFSRQKALGALHRILEKCVKYNQTAWETFSMDMRLAIREHPTRRLLDDLDLAQEELDNISAITTTQQNVIDGFLNQTWHCLPTQRDWFDGLESSYKRLDDNLELYDDLRTQIDKLRKQLTLQLELKQDNNNNKAVLVFTTVTVIFLPLSFVTSYFGMNTTDIRDIAVGQWIFWAISVPFTGFVVTFCMAVAYQGHKVQEYLRGH